MYFVYGLKLLSRTPLDLPECTGSDHEVEFILGPDLSTSLPVSTGELWAKIILRHDSGYALTRTKSGWSLIFPHVAEFHLTPDLRVITAQALPGGRQELIPFLLVGTVLSFLLTLRGETILHASAVALGGEAVAFLGLSRTGKSTLAALLCSHGAQLVTDDVLRLQEEAGVFRCHFGTGSIRIRPRAARIMDGFPASAAGRSLDGRHLLRLGAEIKPPPALKALILPRPSRTCTRLQCQRLSQAKALYYLSGLPRVRGWLVAEPLRQQFASHAQLVRAVPIYEMEIPWGPPFDPGLAGEMLRAVGVKAGSS